MPETIIDKQEVSEEETDHLAEDEEMEEEDDEAIPSEMRPQHEKFVTENDEPLNNIFLDKQQRLLVDSLYASWKNMGQTSPFAAFAKVGVFYSMHEPAFVPDMCLSRITLHKDIMLKKHCAYFSWRYGKAPEVMVEIVSNDNGGGEEDTKKMEAYQRIAVPFYIIYDPLERLKQGKLRAYIRRGGIYDPLDKNWLPTMKLGFTLWQGEFEGVDSTWLRWCNEDGQLFLTGIEQADKERQRAEQLAAKLRALGVDPETQYAPPKSVTVSKA